MAGIIASKSIGTTRGKNKVNGPGKPKERGNKISGSHMAEMIASKPIGTTRGKSKAIKSGKPKERGNKSNGSTWLE